MDKQNTELPDFSGDDFANDKEIQKSRREAEAYNRLINESLAIVKDELGLRKSSHTNFKKFLMFKSLQPILIDSFRAEQSPLPLVVSVAEYRSAFPTAKLHNSGSDLYLFGLIEYQKEFPKSYICRETIREKMVDLLTRQETDFKEHKKFSRSFHVMSQDGKRLTDLFQLKNMDELTAFPDMELEIHEHSCVFRNSRCSISIEEASDFAELAKSLVDVFK
jgi:hypothetical protein